MIPVISLTACHREIREEVLACMAHVYETGTYLFGPEVTAFETEFASFCGTKHCRTAASGTDALFLTFAALGIGPGDEVLVPAQTFVASALAVSRTGATPVFVDIEPESWTISPEQVEQAVTSRTRGILAVHLYGQPCDMERLGATAVRNGLPIIEDNAQAAGATWKTKRTGSLGRIAAHSFFPTKNLGCCGDGGAITTDDPALAERVESLKNYGARERFHSIEQGTNSRLDELQAAILRIKLRKMERWNGERIRLATLYRNLLADVPQIVWQGTLPQTVAVPHLLVVRTADRDGLRTFLRDRGIGTDIHYPIPVPHQRVYHRPEPFPAASKLARECLTLPLYPGLAESDVLMICERIRQFFR